MNSEYTPQNITCGCDDNNFYTTVGTCSRAKIEGLLEAGDRIWTQKFIPEILCIPEEKPDIEQLLNITSQVKILSSKVIKTPVLIVDEAPVPILNQESTQTTGRKLVIEGLLRQKIIYTAAVEKQSVHAAHFDVPFSAFIVLPPDTPLNRKFKVKACIEDIFVCRVTARQVFKNVTVFIKAIPLVC
ncbi:MAG: DUF3794 domain-containing protein [Clostridiales bacterium]|nr:DUF3794 domain-containing protein [Clostridiales bacterium]MCF8022100.1 DUF3794 domain-containing protein [Clostridiales bacterium]